MPDDDYLRDSNSWSLYTDSVETQNNYVLLGDRIAGSYREIRYRLVNLDDWYAVNAVVTGSTDEVEEDECIGNVPYLRNPRNRARSWQPVVRIKDDSEIWWDWRGMAAARR